MASDTILVCLGGRGGEMRETTGDLKIEFSGFQAEIWTRIVPYEKVAQLRVQPPYSVQETALGLRLMRKMWQRMPPHHLLGTLAKFRKTTTSYVMSLCLSVRMKQVGSHWTDFKEIWFLNIFRKCVDKISVLLKSDRNNGYFTWRPNSLW
jgi:hypothetical protein